VPVPVNTLLTEDDYRFMLEDSRARLLVVSEELYPKFAKALAAAAEPPQVIVSGADTHGHAQLDVLLAGAARDPVTAPTVGDDICFWLYTSGSTGKPKAAVHTHADLKLTDDLYGKPYLGIGEDDVCYSVAKLFFAYGLGNALTFPMSAGATTVLLAQRPTPETVADVLKEHGVTVFYAVPTFYAALLASAAAPASGDVKLRRCVSAGEALPSDVGRRFSERYAVDILDGIGSTEMLHIFISNRAGEVKYGTTGKPVPGYDVRLVDDGGHVIEAHGEMGEMQVRGPTSAVMYWNNREQSRATFLGEWTRSGDKYLKDEQGYYVYCGRRDDMLKVGGIYVSPFEVEAALQSHPEVLEAAVVGWPDVDELIKPKAFVVLKSPDQACEALKLTLQDHCREKLAPFKYPRWLEFRSELPKTATGKIQRFKLRAEADVPMPALR
jgi:benzoate-CoA ligase family protein